ncbi:MAG: ABC transporter substrate-binding protein [Hydrogenophaga sp.]|jgi:NitT/TauT family transport system substrate-binding protein|uniref:ABC transporter substrate-binding protein n=1 Tax=Hydrogenophaga sp. TaxID=1904254 RepID=UPI0027242DF3|nr:ABC transporter substrate-binding protein [Hydrogenophaga sp.]MDO9567918.1 ABC transporter substrate-binding protein [Hydrogenophaga sp.]MDP3374095.1 ABC transporter substrate-binding protein [Hydrogenophaga sp.]MDZ4236663.1 ABC transporter substrate-binding protein [Hydrogenophaga sp.]
MNLRLRRPLWQTRWPRVVWVLLGALWLVSCSPAPPAALWRIAVNPWVGYEPWVFAQEMGALPPAVRVVELASNTETKRAFRNGLIEVAALTLDEALRLADEGQALHIVAVLSDSAGADAVLARADVAASLAASTSTSAPSKAMQPLRIGLERTALGELMLAHWLDKARLTLADVQPVHMEAADHENALTSRQVDMLVTFEPMKTRLEQRGAVKVLDTRELPGEVVDVLVARPGLDTTRLAELLLAWDHARQRLTLVSGPPPWLAAGVDLTPTQYLQTLEGLRFLSLADMLQRLQPDLSQTGPAAAPLAQGGQAMSTVLQSLGLIRQPPDWVSLLNPAPLALALTRAPQSATAAADHPSVSGGRP